MNSELSKALQRYLQPDQLAVLAESRVGIAGVGGLGSNVAQHLVRSGLRRLVVADFDRVETSNLNRQFYFPDQIGMLKVTALAENLLRICPDLDIVPHAVRLTRSNLTSIFQDCAVVVEAFDDPPAKKMLMEAYLRSPTFVVSASGIGGWGAPETIRVRRLRSRFWLVGDGESTSGTEFPPLSPRVGIAAAMQADLVLKYLLGRHVKSTIHDCSERDGDCQ